MIYYILSGLIGVANIILWGLYGDLLVEKFGFLKILRSVLFSILWSILLFIINPYLSLFIVALVVISLERITTEIYKALIRVEDQSKYKIPSDLNFKSNHKIKLFLGVLLILILVGFVYFIEIPINKIYLVLIIIGFSLMVLFPSISGKYFLLAIAGGERIISEFYKKILWGRVPGKFKEKRFNKNWQNKRKLLLFLYAFDIIGLIILFFSK